jgi:hypothetical protein
MQVYSTIICVCVCVCVSLAAFKSVDQFDEAQYWYFAIGNL